MSHSSRHTYISFLKVWNISLAGLTQRIKPRQYLEEVWVPGSFWHSTQYTPGQFLHESY